MDPLQLLCSFDLLAAQRPGDRDVGVGNFLIHTIVIVQVDHFELRELATQALREPRRRLPELEAVVKDDKQLHGVVLPQRHRDTEDTEIQEERSVFSPSLLWALNLPNHVNQENLCASVSLW